MRKTASCKLAPRKRGHTFLLPSSRLRLYHNSTPMAQGHLLARQGAAMLVGQQLGPFLIEKELGAGAMGAVYRGKYVKTGQVVAVKVMAPGAGTSGGSAAARFEREAKLLKQLNHPNI